MIRSATLALVLACLAACASGPLPESEARDKEYVTGSNIPRKAGSTPNNVDKVKGQDVERLRDEIMLTQANPGVDVAPR